MSQIAYVASYLGSAGGASRSAIDVLAAITVSGHDVTVISSTGRRGQLPPYWGETQLRRPKWITAPRSFPRELDPMFPRRVAGWALDSIQDPFWHRRILNLDAPDLTIVNSFSQPLVARIRQINPSLSRRTAVVVRGSPVEETFRTIGRTVAWAVDVLAEFDFLIFVSSTVQKDWLKHPKLREKKTFYIPNCCQEDVVQKIMAQPKQQVRERLGLPQDRLVAVCVASVQYRKGQDILLEQLPAILAVAPDLQLFFVGPISSQWGREIQSKAMASEYSSYMRFLGARSNALEYIYAADLCVLPSRAEAMPRVILEAMALKTAVIASAVDGIPELIEHRQSGLLFPLDTPEPMTQAFQTIVTDSDIRAQLTAEAHQRYWKNFSRAQQIDRYQVALNSMLES